MTEKTGKNVVHKQKATFVIREKEKVVYEIIQLKVSGKKNNKNIN